MSADIKPVGWFNPYNETHGYQQVAKEYEGHSETLPLYGEEVIERLRAENARLREALEKIGKLENVTVSDFDGTEWEHQRIARAALAEQGEKP